VEGGATVEPATSGVVRLFLSYAHQNDAMRRELEDHLAPLRAEGLVAWSETELARAYEIVQQLGGSKADGRIGPDVIRLLTSGSASPAPEQG
jgi:hypothetical protein